MNRNADVLQDLIQLARDGAVFYTDAARVELRAQLTAHLPALRATHDAMRRVEQTLAAA
jgi:hypothetical protein